MSSEEMAETYRLGREADQALGRAEAACDAAARALDIALEALRLAASARAAVLEAKEKFRLAIMGTPLP